MIDLETSNIGRRLTYPEGTPRPKRSVQDSRTRFPGWLRIQNLYEKCPSSEHEAIFLSLFHSGCRVSEAIQLRRDMCAWNEQAIYIYGAPVLKLKEKRRKRRDIMIPNNSDNLLYPRFIEYLENGIKLDTGKYVKTDYLLPAYEKFTHELVPDRHTTRGTIYVKLREIDPSLYPHQLRAWCAGSLVEEHDLNVFDLQQWFNWRSADTPSWYARTREKDLEAKLGIWIPPKLE